jgi:hypothetical protein
MIFNMFGSNVSVSLTVCLYFFSISCELFVTSVATKLAKAVSINSVASVFCSANDAFIINERKLVSISGVKLLGFKLVNMLYFRHGLDATSTVISLHYRN